MLSFSLYNIFDILINILNMTFTIRLEFKIMYNVTYNFYISAPITNLNAMFRDIAINRPLYDHIKARR